MVCGGSVCATADAIADSRVDDSQVELDVIINGRQCSLSFQSCNFLESDMGESLQQKIREINRATRRMIWCWAICSLIAAVLLILLVSGAVDYLFRYQDVGMRYLVFVVAMTGLFFSARRLVTAIRSARFSDLEIASWIEQRAPGMGDRLTSSLQFIDRISKEGDTVPTGESLAMRRAVIGNAEKELANIDVQKMLDYSAVRVAAVFAFVALLLAASLFVFRGEMVRIGIKRVLMPWSETDWPRRNQLYFHNLVDKMPQGSEFVAVVKDHNQRLPDEVRFEFVLLGEDVIQTRVMQSTDDAMQVRLENVQRSLRYRAVGGDDQTQWHEMLVLPAPQLEEVEFRIIAPEYAQLPDRLVNGDVKAIAGSALQATGVGSEELVAVHANWTTNDRTIRIPATLDASREHWRFPANGQFQLQDSGVIQFELRNAQSISGGLESRFRIQVVADQPPVIDLTSLDTSRSLTPAGKLRLQVSVNEDVRLKSVTFSATVQTSDQQLSQLLWENQQPTVQAEQVRFTDETATGGPQRLETEFVFAGSSLNLKFGDVVTLVVNATDALDQTASSNKLNFRITTANELLDGLMERQNEVFKRFREALNKQQQSARQVDNVQARMIAATEAHAEIADLLYAARLPQDQVAELLGDPETGAAHLLKPILDEAQANGLEQLPIFKQTAEILQEVTSINTTLIEPVQFQMAQAIRTSKLDDAAEELTQQLKPLRTTQQEIIRRLQDLVGQISQIDRLRDVVRQWLEIRDKQQKLSALTTQLARKSVGKQFNQLDNETKSLLKRAAQQQAELAGDAQQATETISALSERNDIDAVEHTQIAKAKALLDESQIDRKMRNAATEIGTNQLGNAGRNQLDSERLIEDLLQMLQGAQPESADKVSGNQEAGAAVRDLIERQTKISGRLQVLAETDRKDADAFADLLQQQTEISGQLNQMHSDAQSRQDQLLGDQLERASQSAEETRQSLELRQATTAREHSDETIVQLKQLEKSLQDRIARDQSRQNQARDQQAIALLTELLHQQQAAIAQWQKLDAESVAAADATRMSVAETEQQLGSATSELSERFADQIAVEFVLLATAKRLDAIANSIREQQEGVKTGREMQLAADEFARILKAISQQQERQKKQPGDQQTADAEPAEKSPLSEAELQLLLEMQQAILDETSKLHQTRDDTELTAEQQSQLDLLAQRQSALQGIVQLYLKSKPEKSAEEVPEKNTIPELPGF
jgi:hypothetical protein